MRSHIILRKAAEASVKLPDMVWHMGHFQLGVAPMNPRLEPVLMVIALWLAVAVVLAFAFAGCAVPLR